MRQISPSKLSTFLDCPAKYKFKYIDRLPDPSGPAARRGLMVHDALELLYDAEPKNRTLTRALLCADMVADEYPDVDKDEVDLLIWNLFALEDPTTVALHSTELDATHDWEDGWQWRGILDRFDHVDGKLQVVDYKSGKVPSPQYMSEKTLGMKFYGTMARALGYDVDKLVLLYLGTPERLEITLTDAMERTTKNKVRAGTAAIEACEAADTWKPKPAFGCKFCPFLESCDEGKKSVDRANKGK